MLVFGIGRALLGRRPIYGLAMLRGRVAGRIRVRLATLFWGARSWERRRFVVLSRGVVGVIVKRLVVRILVVDDIVGVGVRVVRVLLGVICVFLWRGITRRSAIVADQVAFIDEERGPVVAADVPILDTFVVAYLGDDTTPILMALRVWIKRK